MFSILSFVHSVFVLPFKDLVYLCLYLSGLLQLGSYYCMFLVIIIVIAEIWKQGDMTSPKGRETMDPKELKFGTKLGA